MLQIETLDALRTSVEQTVQNSRAILESAMDQVRGLNNDFRVLKPRTITSFSMVASDGGHNKIEFNPFSLTVVRVVDSKGKELFVDCVSPSTDIEALAKHNLDADTKVGRLMKGLGVTRLPDLSTALNPKENSAGWVTVYRDICEWAALYDLIVNRGPRQQHDLRPRRHVADQGVQGRFVHPDVQADPRRHRAQPPRGEG